MKLLAYLSITFGLLSFAIGAYHLLETEPNREYYADKRLEIMSDFGFSDEISAAQKQLRDKFTNLWESTESASDTQGMAMVALALLGFLAGLVALLKGKQKLGLLGLLISLGSAIIPLITKTHMFS